MSSKTTRVTIIGNIFASTPGPSCLLSHAQNSPLSLRLWCELEPMVQEYEDYPLSTEEAQRRALEEAREILSGMVYGYRFRYTPGDRVRSIEEEFLLTPVAEIRWGDPNMRVADAVNVPHLPIG